MQSVRCAVATVSRLSLPRITTASARNFHIHANDIKVPYSVPDNAWGRNRSALKVYFEGE